MSYSTCVETFGIFLSIGAIAIALFIMRYRIRVLEAEATENKKKLERWENEFPQGINDVQQKMMNVQRTLSDQIESIKTKIFK